MDLWWFQYLVHSLILGDPAFLNVIDGTAVSLQSTNHNPSNATTHNAALNHDHSTRQNGHDWPIVGCSDYDLKIRATIPQRYLPSPLEHLDVLNLLSVQRPLPIHELRLQYDVH